MRLPEDFCGETSGKSAVKLLAVWSGESLGRFGCSSSMGKGPHFEPMVGAWVMNLLRKLGCLLFGHAPVVERRGHDSVLVCERCHRVLDLFVKNLYAAK